MVSLEFCYHLWTCAQSMLKAFPIWVQVGAIELPKFVKIHINSKCFVVVSASAICGLMFMIEAIFLGGLKFLCVLVAFAMVLSRCYSSPLPSVLHLLHVCF
jgi:hypothetical protein